MNNLNSLADFVYALMNDYPESSGIDDDNSSKKDNFFRKYHTGLQDLKNINYDRLYQLVSEQSNKFIPSVATIKELAKQAYKSEYVDARLVSFCFRQNGKVLEYAFPRRELENFRSTIENIKKESEKFWYGTTHDEPV